MEQERIRKLQESLRNRFRIRRFLFWVPFEIWVHQRGIRLYQKEGRAAAARPSSFFVKQTFLPCNLLSVHDIHTLRILLIELAKRYVAHYEVAVEVVNRHLVGLCADSFQASVHSE